MNPAGEVVVDRETFKLEFKRSVRYADGYIYTAALFRLFGVDRCRCRRKSTGKGSTGKRNCELIAPGNGGSLGDQPYGR